MTRQCLASTSSSFQTAFQQRLRLPCRVSAQLSGKVLNNSSGHHEISLKRHPSKASLSRRQASLAQTKPTTRFFTPLNAIADEGSIETDNPDVGTDLRAVGSVWEGTIKRYNRGGVIIFAGGRKGFCPYRFLDPTRLEGDFKEPGEFTDKSYLVDQPINVLVHDLDDQGRAILSETAYMTMKALDYYKVGDVVKVKVAGIQPYGVFVEVPSEDGIYHGVRAMIHSSELSWDYVPRPDVIVQVGDEIEAFVKSIKRYSNQLYFSLRHDYLDPLKESVSSLLPIVGEAYQNVSWEESQSLSPELTSIVDCLKAEEAIEDVQPARQAEIQHKVSRDLEIWLSRDEVDDGFILVAWSGRTLRELRIRTSLSREEIKTTLREVLKRTM